MDLSIIIPVYNAAPLLNRCLDSIFSQETQYTFEVILVDDESTDNSIEIIKSRKEENISFYQQKNSGPSSARNKGIEMAKGEYIAFLDADDYWNKDYIEKTVYFLKENKECVAVTVGQKHIAIGKKPFHSPKLQETEPFIIDNFFSFWAKYQHVGTCSTTMRTIIVKETNGQRTDLRVTEDFEFWFFLSTFGKWGMIPETLYISDGGDVTKKEGWLNKVKIRWYNAPTIDVWQERIKGRILNNKVIGYNKALAIIVRNLVYCYLLSEREILARKEILTYGKYFNDRMGKFMYLTAHNPIIWKMAVKWLKYREYNK